MGAWSGLRASPSLHIDERGSQDVSTLNWLFRGIESCLIFVDLLIGELSEILVNEGYVVVAISITS